MGSGDNSYHSYDLATLASVTNRLHGEYRVAHALDGDSLLVSEIEDLLSIEKRMLQELVSTSAKASPKVCKIVAESLRAIESRTISIGSARGYQFRLLSEAYRGGLLNHTTLTREAASLLQILEELL